MSLILDALARSEKEKNAEPLEAHILSASEGEAARRGRPPRSLVAAVALPLGAVLAWAVMTFLGSQTSAPLPVDPSANATGAAQTGEVPRLAESHGESEREGSSKGAERSARARNSAPQPVAGRPQREAAVKETDRALRTAPDERIAALYEQPVASATSENSAPPAASNTVPVATPDNAATPVPPSGTTSESPVDLEKVLREVREEARSDGLEPHPAPLLADLSQQFRNSVPTLMYLRHDYNPQARSTVLINGETLRAGQRTRGVELVDVLADSVILRFKGTEFRLRALNSWVNL